MATASGAASLSFAQIADRIIAGDSAAVEILFERFTQPFMHLLLNRYGVSYGTAHDLTQDSLLEIMQKLRSGELTAPEKRPHATDWAYGFLTNNAKSYLRKKSGQRAASIEAMSDEEVGSLRDRNARRPQSIVDDREKQELLEKIKLHAREEIEKTTGKTREILDLYLRGMRLVEIARELEMDPGLCQHYLDTARTRIVANAQARALGLDVPEPKPVTYDLISDTLSRLPEHQRRIGRMACLEGLWKSPDEIARRTGYRLKLVQTNLEHLWRLLSHRYHREFPESLEHMEEA